MAQTLKLKRSAVSGNTPTTSDLALGEIAINTYDGNIFIKKNDGSESIVTFSPGSNAGSIEEDSFSGNGSTAAFTLSTAPSSEENLLVFIDATFQNRDSFTISGTTITFDTAPDNGSSVRVYHIIPGTVDDGILTVAKFAADTLVTEAEGISSNDNDTTIPTSAAVKDYVDTQVATVDTLPEVLANGNTTGGTDISVSSGDDITFADSSKAIFGASSDLQIYHNATDSVIETITGDLYITNKADDSDIIFRTDDGAGGFTPYLKLDGTNVQMVASQKLAFEDNVRATFGASSDLSIYHDGSHSFITDSGTGDLRLQGTNLALQNAAGTKNYFLGSDGGAATLYHNNTSVLSTTADGISVTSEVEAEEFIGDLRGAVLFKAQAGEDLTKGDIVYISGISGNTTVVSKAKADDASKMPAFGVASATASNNSSVTIYTFGTLSSIDTSSFTEGDELFVSTTAGAFTNSAPTGESSQIQKIAKVTRSDSSAGSIKIMGAGRSNAVPNLDEDQFFLGNASNQAVATDFSDAVEALSINNVVEDTTPQLGGNLASNGNDILFADNDKAIFGTGSDLEIFHNGTTSYIRDVGDGDLQLFATDDVYIRGYATNNYMARFNENGAVTLYHNNSSKFATTSTGIDVTGEVLADSLDIDGNGDISGNLTLGGYLAGPATFTIDPAAVGDNTGTVVIAGNLQVDGTTTTINSTTLTVDDKNITLASGSTNAAAANGAGLTVDCGTDSDATFTYDCTNDEWDFNKDINVTGTITADGLTLGSNEYIQMGGAGEFQIFNDGSNTVLRSSDNFLIQRNTSPRTSIKVTDSSGEVELSYAGSPKLATTSTGIDVTGTVTSDGLTVDGNAEIGSIETATNFPLIVKSGTNDHAIAIEEASGAETWQLGVDSAGSLRFYNSGATSSTVVFNDAGNVGIGATSPNAKLQVEEYGIDTTETSTTATTQVAIHTMSATTFRSARFTVQVTNSTDSTYHLTEILMIHDGTTPSITEYGTIFTGSAEATFDADISSGNVRLLATPATTDSMAFKVVAHTITT